jgi:hypothetical protein
MLLREMLVVRAVLMPPPPSSLMFPVIVLRLMLRLPAAGA